MPRSLKAFLAVLLLGAVPGFATAPSHAAAAPGASSPGSDAIAPTPAAGVAALVSSAGPSGAKVASERNAGPAGRLEPRPGNVRFERRTSPLPQLTARASGMSALQSRHREYTLALALSRIGFPSWRSAAPPPLQIV